MTDLSDFKRGQLVGACMAGTNMTKITESLGVARSTVSKVMTAFEKEGKNLLTEAKLWKIAKADCQEGTQEYNSENYSRA